MQDLQIIIFLGIVVMTVQKISASKNEVETLGLQAHNNYRKLHGSPDLQLKSELNEKAMSCATFYLAKELIDHTCPHKDTTTNIFKALGENLYMSMGDETSSDTTFVQKAVDGWYGEQAMYDFTAGAAYKHGDKVGHFTQLVWKDVKFMGVAFIQKEDIAIVVVLYDPPGNIKGQYQKNVIRELTTGGGAGHSHGAMGIDSPVDNHGAAGGHNHDNTGSQGTAGDTGHDKELRNDEGAHHSQGSSDHGDHGHHHKKGHYGHKSSATKANDYLNFIFYSVIAFYLFKIIR